jgi:hypothetical protein
VRFLACTAFVLAAFAWVPPHIDRAGLAALGLGLMALTIKRPKAGGIAELLGLARGPALEPMPAVPPVTIDMPEQRDELDDLEEGAADVDALRARLSSYGYGGAGGLEQDGSQTAVR